MEPAVRMDASRLDVRDLDQEQTAIHQPASQRRQDADRILHVLQRVIHRDRVEAAGWKRAVLNEAGGHGYAKRLTRVARISLVRLEAHRVEAGLAQHVNDFTTAGTGIQHSIARLQKRREVTIAIQRAPAGACDVAQRRRGAAFVVEPIRTSSSPGRGFDHTSPHWRQIVVLRGWPSRSRDPSSSTSTEPHKLQGIGQRVTDGSRSARTAGVRSLRENSSAASRTSAAAPARRFSPGADP